MFCRERWISFTAFSWAGAQPRRSATRKDIKHEVREDGKDAARHLVDGAQVEVGDSRDHACHYTLSR